MKDKDRYHRYHTWLEMLFSSVFTMPDSPQISSTKNLNYLLDYVKKKKKYCYQCQSLKVVSLCLMIYPEKPPISVHIDLTLSFLSLTYIVLYCIYVP